ncbi:MAG: OmpA family protein [Candidatus Coatesbacteria bacterium]|nr:OmpA family protein [Candidatus Coatesbacteria bacterium]
MNRGLASVAGIAVGICIFAMVANTGLGAIVTVPTDFNWLLADEDYSRFIGELSVGQDLYDRGIELLYDGKFGEATECFWRVIDIYTELYAFKSHPLVSSTYYYLGKTYLLAGRPGLAKGLFELALHSHPTGDMIQAKVDLDYSETDTLREQLRAFALQRELDRELPGASAIHEPADWEEVIPMDSLFDFNEYTLRPDATPLLEKVVRRMKLSHGLTFVIEANSDDVGSQEYNLWLGTKRAEAVKEALCAHGLLEGSMRCVSYGKLLPVAPNSTEDGRYKNRRLVIKAIQQ